MKILLVIDQFDAANNGTTISAKRFAETLQCHGHEIRVVSTGTGGDSRYPVRELRLLPIANRIVKKQGMTFALPDRQTLEEAISWAEVVHFLMPFPLSLSGLKVAKRLGVPHTAAFHVQPENITYTLGMGKITPINTAIYQYFKNVFYNQFTHIHCPSRFIADQLRQNGYTAKLHVISNGIDRDFVYRKQPKSPDLEGKFVVLMVGRFSNEKRQDVLIDAIEKSRFSNQIQLILAGQGPNEGKYRRLGTKLTHPPILRFFDKPQLIDIMAMSDLYVHAADAEIEAISCMEAFSSGLVPVISNSPNSATPQFALDERSLFLPGNADDLAGKIDYWIEHSDERCQMEKRYSEHGKQYGIDACVSQIEDMFLEAIEETQYEQAHTQPQPAQ